MTEKLMSLERLTEICAAYGQDPRHWPRDERAAVEALAAANGEAHAVLQNASRLDGYLDRFPVAPATAQLRAKILASAPGVPASSISSWVAALRDEIFGWKPALPALVVALFLGVAAGLLASEAEDEADLVQMAAFQNDLGEY